MSKKNTACVRKNVNHNYLNTQKSNAHTKINGNLVQLWFGGVLAAFALSMQPAVAALNDGNLEVGEQCDDGNTVNGDGCDAAGQIESGFIAGCATPTFTYSNEAFAGNLGGTGGAPSPDMSCGSTEVLIGLGFKWNSTFRAAVGTTTVCGVVTTDISGNTITTETSSTSQQGNFSVTHTTAPVLCQSGYAITNITGDRGYSGSENTVFSAVKMTCSKLGVDGKPTGVNYTVEIGDSNTAGYTPVYDQSASCPSGTISKKFTARLGGAQDGLELYCAEPATSCLTQTSILDAVIGDGQVVGSEQCDDGNVVDGDGCSATGQVEAGYVCDVDADANAICDTTGAGSVVILDTDNDLVPNNIDLDNDNDGILDTVEDALLQNEDGGTFGEISDGNHRDLQANVQSYSYGGGVTNGLIPSATYAVTSRLGAPSLHSSNLWIFEGHTTGTQEDAFLAVNGSDSGGIFYTQQVTLFPNSDYNMSFWTRSASTGDSRYKIVYEVIDNNSGNVIATLNTPSTGIPPMIED